MRRGIRHFFFLFALVAGVGAGLSEWGKWPELDSELETLPENTRARLVFQLGKEKWTEFRTPSNANRLTILSRANFDPGELELSGLGYPYEIEYRIESLRGKELARGTFFLKARIVPMVDREGAARQGAFFRDRSRILSSAKLSTLELPPGLLVVRLRLLSKARAIEGITVRSFLTREIDQTRPDYLWKRLNEDSLREISRRRVHDLTAITNREKLAILQNRRVPLGPFGVAGRDFEQRTLFIRDDLVPAGRELIEPLGVGELRCGSGRRTVIGIPHPGGRIRLELRRSGNPASHDRAEAVIRYFGETIHQREELVRRVGDGITGFSGVFGPGLLEIASHVPLTIRPFFAREGGEEQLLEPDPPVARAWRTGGPGEHLHFSRPVLTEPSFFRFSVRPMGSCAANLFYTFLDEEGREVKSGSREIESIPSLYDVELGPDGDRAVSDPVHLVLEVPAGVAGIRVESDESLLINGYVRPAGLVHRTRVPFDYVRALPDPERLPVWFALRPDAADDLIRDHRSHLLQVQTRPPEDDADILSGKFQWTDFQPVDGFGQYLLLDREPDAPARIESLPSLFAPVSDGVDGSLLPDSPPGVRRPNRRLAFYRDSGEPEMLRLFINGELFFQRRLVHSRGEIPLPAFPPDTRFARVECPSKGLRCFVNYVQAGTATKLKRRAFRFRPGDRIEYTCAKATAGEELITGMFFTPGGSDDETEISVSIVPDENGGFFKESESFTLRKRLFRISPGVQEKTPVLGGSFSVVDSGRRFFIPFGRDLKPGSYRVILVHRGGSEGYLSLSRVLGGDYTETRFFRETRRL